MFYNHAPPSPLAALNFTLFAERQNLDQGLEQRLFFNPSNTPPGVFPNTISRIVNANINLQNCQDFTVYIQVSLIATPQVSFQQHSVSFQHHTVSFQHHTVSFQHHKSHSSSTQSHSSTTQSHSNTTSLIPAALSLIPAAISLIPIPLSLIPTPQVSFQHLIPRLI